MKYPLILCALAFLPGAVEAQNATTPTLKNSDFEGTYGPALSNPPANKNAHITGTIAPGWQDNSDWAEVTIDYGPDATNPHRGQVSQRVTVGRIASGAAQFVQPVHLQKGHGYRFSAFLRGQAGQSVTMLMRQGGAPYQTYASASCSVSPEWRQFSVAGTVPEEADAFLMLIANGPQTYFVDDANLEDLQQAFQNVPPKIGNLIQGGNFEAGPSFGWGSSISGPVEVNLRDPQPQWDGTTGAIGKASIKFTVYGKDQSWFYSPVFSPTPYRRHAIALWMKADQADTNVNVSLENTSLVSYVKLGTQWQRVTFAGDVPFVDWTRLRVQCWQPGTDRTIWVDGVQVEEKAESSPDYVPAAPCELTLGFDRPGHVLFDAERGVAAVRIAPVPLGAHLQFTLEALDGTKTTWPPVAIPASGQLALPLPLNARRPRGIWKLSAVVVGRNGKPLSATVPLVYARLPHPKELDPNTSFFGTHITPAPYYIAVARATGNRWVRAHDTFMGTKWPVVEPEPGQWKFFDTAIDNLNKAGLRMLGMLDGAPPRTSTKPREGGYWNIWNIPDKSDAPAQWETYVRTITSHYKGRIDAWEIWNEPWGNWWIESGNPNATPQLYADLMKRAYTTAKAANPNATIIGVDTVSGSDDKWTIPVLKASGTAAFDAFSFHDYTDATYAGPDNSAVIQTRHFRELQSAVGTPKPLWDTEGGLFSVGSWYAPVTGGMAPQSQAAYITHLDVTQMAAGVRHFFLYALPSRRAMGETSCNVIEHDGAIRPILAARAVLASLVDGLGIPVRSEPQKGVDLFTFSQGKKRVQVAWNYDVAPHALRVPPGARVLDVWGNPVAPGRGGVALGVEPVYFTWS